MGIWTTTSTSLRFDSTAENRPPLGAPQKRSPGSRVRTPSLSAREAYPGLCLTVPIITESLPEKPERFRRLVSKPLCARMLTKPPKTGGLPMCRCKTSIPGSNLGGASTRILCH